MVRKRSIEEADARRMHAKTKSEIDKAMRDLFQLHMTSIRETQDLMEELVHEREVIETSMNTSCSLDEKALEQELQKKGLWVSYT